MTKERREYLLLALIPLAAFALILCAAVFGAHPTPLGHWCAVCGTDVSESPCHEEGWPLAPVPASRR